MNHYIETGSKRQRVCKMASETMSVADKAFEVFMRWYIDERIHQLIADQYQWMEVVHAAWEREHKIYEESTPEAYIKAFELHKGEDVGHFHPSSSSGWTKSGALKLEGADRTIAHYNNLLVNKEQLQWPLKRKEPEMGEDNRPKMPTVDAFDLVEQLLKDF